MPVLPAGEQGNVGSPEADWGKSFPLCALHQDIRDTSSTPLQGLLKAPSSLSRPIPAEAV